jgi:hypothetical protein
MTIKILVNGWEEKTFDKEGAVRHVINNGVDSRTGELERLQSHLDKTVDLLVALYERMETADVVDVLNQNHYDTLTLE